MQYKALVFDLDGTLLVGETLPEPNRDALVRAIAAGYTVVIATARWKEMARRIADQVGATTPSIACSGAQVYDWNSESDLFDHRLPAAFAAELFELCNHERCIATITFDDRIHIKMDGEPKPGVLHEEMRWTPALPGVDVHGQSPRIAAIQGTRINELIKNELWPAHRETVAIHDSIGPSGKLITTITSVRADKGEALRCASAHLDIPLDQFIAFGDAENDLPMFAAAGAAVSMGQAVESVRSRADYISRPHDQGGVAHAIELLLDGGLSFG